MPCTAGFSNHNTFFCHWFDIRSPLWKNAFTTTRGCEREVSLRPKNDRFFCLDVHLVCPHLTLVWAITQAKSVAQKYWNIPVVIFFTSIGIISLVSSLAGGRMMLFLCCLMSCVTSLGLQMTRWISHTRHCKEKDSTEYQCLSNWKYQIIMFSKVLPV